MMKNGHVTIDSAKKIGEKLNALKDRRDSLNVSETAPRLYEEELECFKFNILLVQDLYSTSERRGATFEFTEIKGLSSLYCKARAELELIKKYRKENDIDRVLFHTWKFNSLVKGGEFEIERRLSPGIERSEEHLELRRAWIRAANATDGKPSIQDVMVELKDFQVEDMKRDGERISMMHLSGCKTPVQADSVRRTLRRNREKFSSAYNRLNDNGLL